MGVHPEMSLSASDVVCLMETFPCKHHKKMKIDAETDQMPEIDYSEDGLNGEGGMEDERSNVDRSLSPSGKFDEIW